MSDTLNNDLQAQIEQPAGDTAVNNLTSRSRRLSLADIELMLRLKEQGRTQVQIAETLGCSQATVSATLSRIQHAPQLTQALAKSQAVPMLHRWIRASKEAAKRGDHRPAREFIELASPELRPQPANSAGGGGVTINIGMPGKPLELPVIEVSPVPETASALSLSAPIAVSDVNEEAKATPIEGVSPVRVA